MAGKLTSVSGAAYPIVAPPVWPPLRIDNFGGLAAFGPLFSCTDIGDGVSCRTFCAVNRAFDALLDAFLPEIPSIPGSAPIISTSLLVAGP